MGISVILVWAESGLFSIDSGDVPLAEASVFRNKARHRVHFAELIFHFPIKFPGAFALVDADGHVKDSKFEGGAP